MSTNKLLVNNNNNNNDSLVGWINNTIRSLLCRIEYVTINA